MTVQMTIRTECANCRWSTLCYDDGEAYICVDSELCRQNQRINGLTRERNALVEERDELRAQLTHAAGVVKGMEGKIEPANEYVARLETAIGMFLNWYDAVTPETDDERTERVGMCEFEALLQDDDDLYITADDPELAAIVGHMRAALPEVLRAQGQ